MKEPTLTHVRMLDYTHVTIAFTMQHVKVGNIIEAGKLVGGRKQCG